MRTAIYVHTACTVTINTAEDQLTLVSMVVPTTNGIAVESVTCELARENERALTPGVYLVRSTLPVKIGGTTGSYYDIILMSDDKSKWPEPNVQVMALVPNSALASFEPFFNGGRDMDDRFMNGEALGRTTMANAASHEH